MRSKTISNFVTAGFFILLAMALIFPIQDGDLFFYLSMGRLMTSTGSLPSLDPFMYLAKNWHVTHEWFSYLIFYAFYVAAGFWGLMILKMTLWFAAFFILFRAGRKWQIQDGPFYLILFLAALACSHRFVERASLFSDLAVLWMAWNFLKTKKLSRAELWTFPLLFLFWANIHPGFVLGLALFAAYVLIEGRGQRKLWISFGLSFLACFFNPDFWRGVIYPLQTAFKSDWALYRSLNYEWMPTFQQPFLSAWEVKALILLTMVTFVLLLAATLKRKGQFLFPFLIFILALYLAQEASRFMTTSALLMALLALISLREIQWKFSSRAVFASQSFFAVLFTVLCLWIAVNGYNSTSGHRTLQVGVDSAAFPVKAVEFIKEKNLHGRFFNQYDWGSYLIWTLNRPDSLFIHGHIDDPKLLAFDYQGMNQSQQFFDDSVKKYDIQYFLLDKQKLLVSPQPQIVSYLSSWKILYQDDTAVLWGH